MNKIFIVVAIIFVGFCILFFFFFNNNNNSNNASYKKISYEEMLEINDDGIILDVRTYDEFIELNLEESINLPLDEIQNIESIVSDKNKQIFIYCRSGSRSMEAVKKLIEMGYTDVYDVGGIININL